MENKVGRPLLFKNAEELEKRIELYMQRCCERERPITMSGLASYLGVSRQTLVNYSYKDEFVDTIKKARDMVQADMEERALCGLSNPTFSIFSLKNNFGWVDKQEVSSKNENVNKNIDLSHLSTKDIKQLLKEE